MDQECYNNKICIVTGANSGIGYALSKDLLNRGVTIYMAGRNPEKVAKAVATPCPIPKHRGVDRPRLHILVYCQTYHTSTPLLK
jgi:NAD(P)-dependent dehydrogenase (short-subunit alcohol dehydrogenase family)